MLAHRGAAVALSAVLVLLSGTAAGASATETKNAPPANVFTVAVFPDTQTWVTTEGDNRFPTAVNYLLKNKKSLNLQSVLHTGDITNWGWLDKPQYTRASENLQLLTNASVPVSVTSGNHDTRAVGHDGVEGSRKYGGSAYQGNPECREKFGDKCRSDLLVRETQEFNDAFPGTGKGVVKRKGQAENSYKLNTINGVKFLTLTLEFAPRAEVVKWANEVISSDLYSKRNVIIQTHHYLTDEGKISPSNNGYGAKSPQYIYDNLVKNNPNVKMIFSGHTGTFASRVDDRNGNPVVSLMSNTPAEKNATVRVVRINTKSGKIESQIIKVEKGEVVKGSDFSAKLKLIGVDDPATR